MLDSEAFLAVLYVAVDEFRKAQPPVPPRPVPPPSLAPRAVVTLARYARWERFGYERAFHRHARVRMGRGAGSGGRLSVPRWIASACFFGRFVCNPLA